MLIEASYGIAWYHQGRNVHLKWLCPKSLLWDILMFIGEKDKEDASKDNKKEPLVRQKKKKKN